MATIPSNGSLHDIYWSGEMCMDEEGKLQAYFGGAASKLTFFSLPQEIRDRTYELVLVPQSPIEFAPIEPGVPHKRFYELDYEDHGHGWYGFRYEFAIVSTLQILKASKRVYTEAAMVFYSQPFRFSNQAGWIVLEYWLKRIGPRNAAYVKDVTVCHPAWSGPPTSGYDIGGFVSGQRSFGLAIQDCNGYDPTDWMATNRGYEHDTVGREKLMSMMPSLRKLRLLLHMAGPTSYGSAISRQSRPLSTTLQLVKCLELMLSYCISSLPEEAEGADLADTNIAEHKVRMRAALTALKERGIQIIEIFHDQHRFYPVNINEGCINTGLCDYMFIMA